MRTLLAFSVLTFLIVLGIVLGGMAGAPAATTGQLQLQGVVPVVLSLSVTPQPAATTLDLTSTQTDLLVASINEVSNSNTGYKISISSLNDGDLERSGGTETLTYSLKYDSVVVNLVGSSVTPVVAKTNNVGSVHNLNSDVSISYTGQSSNSMVSGTYIDTLTFEIEVN